ncbi:hypothetical protein TgHK011_001304 [Trichoderma gracile]|nr:hypothetical protein TgHK011_001304 [Trichoderma gracile]
MFSRARFKGEMEGKYGIKIGWIVGEILLYDTKATAGTDQPPAACSGLISRHFSSLALSSQGFKPSFIRVAQLQPAWGFPESSLTDGQELQSEMKKPKGLPLWSLGWSPSSSDFQHLHKNTL